MRRQGSVCSACNGTFGKNEGAVVAANGQSSWEAFPDFYATADDPSGKKYHSDHYRCKICDQKIPTKYPSALHNGELYCQFHVAIKFSSRCSGCGEAIMKVGLVDPDDPTRSLHENCFQIRKVGVLTLAFEPIAYYLHSEPYHAELRHLFATIHARQQKFKTGSSCVSRPREEGEQDGWSHRQACM